MIPPAPDPRTYGVLLWILLALFFLRVVGQVIVAAWRPQWLPEMKQWYSGLLPYPVLLPIQIVMLGVMAVIALHVSRGTGYFAVQRPTAGTWMVWLSFVYAGAMVVRFILWLRTPPARRRAWIPIIFHLVLAAFLFVLGRVWEGRGSGAGGQGSDASLLQGSGAGGEGSDANEQRGPGPGDGDRDAAVPDP